jgi:transposase
VAPLQGGFNRLAFEASLQRVAELSAQRGEESPWASKVRTGQQLQKGIRGLWTFLKTRGLEPTSNATERALRQTGIQRKISRGVQSANGAFIRSHLVLDTTTQKQQGRDVWEFLEQGRPFPR